MMLNDCLLDIYHTYMYSRETLGIWKTVHFNCVHACIFSDYHNLLLKHYVMTACHILYNKCICSRETLERHITAIRLQELYKKRQEERENEEIETRSIHQPLHKIKFKGHRNARTMVELHKLQTGIFCMTELFLPSLTMISQHWCINILELVNSKLIMIML